jgi:putative flavoprotein involved in K+ transport
MPRTYRDRDIMWWLDQLGRHDERFDEVDDLVRARNVPSPQLVGTPERADLDLNALTDNGATLVGRLGAVRGSTASFSGSLRNVCDLADLKAKRLLKTIDQFAGLHEGPRLEPTRVVDPQVHLDLDGFDTVLWATGFRADYSWLDIDVLDRKGEIRHDGGVVTASPGLYRVGLNFLRRRKSSFIHGAEDDARELVEHLAARSQPAVVRSGRR